MGSNPATGEPLRIPAKTVVKMRVAKAARESDCTGEKEVKGGDFIKKKPEEINQKGTLYGGLP